VVATCRSQLTNAASAFLITLGIQSSHGAARRHTQKQKGELRECQGPRKWMRFVRVNSPPRVKLFYSCQAFNSRLAGSLFDSTSMAMEEKSMESLVTKLNDIAGFGKLANRELRLRSLLNWRTKAKSSIRHLLHGEQRPSLEEAKEIEAAHLKHCAEKIERNRAETIKLFNTMRASIAAMEASDPEFYEPHIAMVREALFSDGNTGG
jgi:hypothetical protein